MFCPKFSQGGFWLSLKSQSGRRDLNPRPSAPKALDKASEALGEAIEKQQVIDETAKLQEINAAKAARLQAWQNMTPMERMAANPPSAQAVAQARAAWQISE